MTYVTSVWFERLQKGRWVVYVILKMNFTKRSFLKLGIQQEGWMPGYYK